jgi:hypothetical protein
MLLLLLIEQIPVSPEHDIIQGSRSKQDLTTPATPTTPSETELKGMERSEMLLWPRKEGSRWIATFVACA